MNKYRRLEARIGSMIEDLTANLSDLKEAELDYLRRIITPGVYLPNSLYSLFVLARIDFRNNQIMFVANQNNQSSRKTAHFSSFYFWKIIEQGHFD